MGSRLKTEEYLTPSVAKSIAQIATHAGRAIMKIYEQPEAWDVKAKGDASPITQADLRANEIIVTALARLTPEIPILSEESPWTGGKGTTYWAVDPLDGTKEFLKRNGEFTVNIGLVINGIARMGVICAPALSTVWAGVRVTAEPFDATGVDIYVPTVVSPGWACKSVIDFSLDRPIRDFEWITIRVSSGLGGGGGRDMQSLIRVLLSRSHSERDNALLLPNEGSKTTRSIGSSLKFCIIAQGEADYYPRSGPTHFWDTVAGDAILGAAGGSTLSFPNLEPLSYPASCNAFLNPAFIAARSSTSLAKVLKSW
jgi:3'(2'), 5'-bisphosphate nucleotidase